MFHNYIFNSSIILNIFSSFTGLVKNESIPASLHFFSNYSEAYAVNAAMWISFCENFFLISQVASNPSIMGMLQSMNISLQFVLQRLQLHGSFSFSSALRITFSTASLPLRALSVCSQRLHSIIVYKVKILKMLSSTTRMSLRSWQEQAKYYSE